MKLIILNHESAPPTQTLMNVELLMVAASNKNEK
jgi:hypothetical protein